MLAIIIPYFKIKYFAKTLDSLTNQTDKRFFVYIGDDASPEKCDKLLHSYKGKFEFEYFRFEDNIGGKNLTKQWERCIALSKNEEWLMILGDDDWLSDNVVEEFYKNLQYIDKKYNVVRFSSKIFYSSINEYSNLYTHPKEEKYIETYLKKINGSSRSSLSEYIFNRNVYNKYKFYDYPLAWNSDDRAWFDFSESKPILTLNSATLYINVSEESISGMSDNLDIKNKSQTQFYSYLLWQNKLNFNQKKIFSNLILNLHPNLVTNFTLIYAKIILNISKLINQSK